MQTWWRKVVVVSIISSFSLLINHLSTVNVKTYFYLNLQQNTKFDVNPSINLPSKKKIVTDFL